MSNKTAKLARNVAKKAAKRQSILLAQQADMIAQGQMRELLAAPFLIRLKFALRVLRGR
jgi:hypothetical protein